VSRDAIVYLEDMVEAARRVLDYTRGMTREALFADRKTVDAVLRNLEVLGEAAKHVPGDVRARHAGIEWKKIGGLRDILAHEYFAIDDDILWDVVTNKLGRLLPQFEAALHSESTRG
jgi:uncharacterized protein with HEPN domain